MIPPTQNTSGKVNSVTADAILKAHQLTNPKILEILENRNISEKIRLEKRKVGSIGQTLENYNLEQKEDFILKGILIAQEKELSVLDDLDIFEMKHSHRLKARVSKKQW